MVFSDWLVLHGLDVETVADCLAALNDGHLDLNLSAVSAVQGYAGGGWEEPSLPEALRILIQPAFSAAFGDQKMIGHLISAVSWRPIGLGQMPHTVSGVQDAVPEIRMSWNGSTEDLICLAHETAHAIQLQLSAGSFMPPLARETCAFLGELALIGWATTHNKELAFLLLQVWREENQRYFWDDCELLSSALADPEAAYSYRMNYPLARASAVTMWRAGADLKQLFSAGSEAMPLLPLAKIAEGDRPCSGVSVRQGSAIIERERNPIWVSPERAWYIIVAATCAGLPEQRAQIERVARQTVVNLSTDGSDWLPWTILTRPPDRTPVMQGGFDGTARDLVRLAFQFGLALQIAVTPLRHVALVDQDIAGCVCVNLLLDFLHGVDRPLYQQASSAWLEVTGACDRAVAANQKGCQFGPSRRRELPPVDPVAVKAANAAFRVASRLSLWHVVTGEATAMDLLRPASILVIGSDQPLKLDTDRWADAARLQDLGLRGGALRGSVELRPNELLAVGEAVTSAAFVGPHVQTLPSAPTLNVAMAVGLAIHLLAGSPYHRQFPVARYLPVEILPPFRRHQAQLYLDPYRRPVGVVTWARANRDVLSDVLATGRALKDGEWNCGPYVFINDWITEQSAFRSVVTDVETRLFPYEIATSIRRTPEGGVRRVNRWRGIGLRRSMALHDPARSEATPSAGVPRMTCPGMSEALKQAHAVSLFKDGARAPQPNI